MEKNRGEKFKIIVATTSLPAVDRPNVDRWNATRSLQYLTISETLSYPPLSLCPGYFMMCEYSSKY